MEKTAYFAGGCFWCMEHSFRSLHGVSDVISGYSGGNESHPKYEDVKAQKTGHRETVKILFCPEKVTYRKLLRLFLSFIDPNDDGGQFVDRGHSYTCAVYYADETQRRTAEEVLTEVCQKSGRRPAVALEPFVSFYEAEDYHQNYAGKEPEKYKEEWIRSGRDAYFSEKQETGEGRES